MCNIQCSVKMHVTVVAMSGNVNFVSLGCQIGTIRAKSPGMGDSALSGSVCAQTE